LEFLLGHLRDQDLSSRSLSLSSRDQRASTTAPGHLLDCRSWTFPGTDSLRLFFPSTHAGNGSPLARVCLALSVPLSGFLFTLLAASSSRTLRNRFSGPSVHGVRPFRVFLPLKSRAAFAAYCSHALWRVGYGRASRRCWDSRALLPSKSRARESAITLNPEPLLSWGLPALGCFTVPTLVSHETLPLSHFPSPPKRPARCPRVLLPGERHSSEERAYPSAVLSLFNFPTCLTRNLLMGHFFRRMCVLALLRKLLPHP